VKRQPTITADAVPRIFDDERIKRLASEGAKDADLEILAKAVRKAVDIYLSEAAAVSSNDIHHQIARLYRAAVRRKYQETGDRVRKLSAGALAFLKKRRVPPSLGWKIPDDTDVLLDPATQDQACETIVSLCRIGGHWQQGRQRPSGRPSMTFVPHLQAPPLRRHFSKRKAELNFVMNLQLAYAEATGKLPPLTARHVTSDKRLASTVHMRKRLSPFALMARECLKLVGRPDADVVELINELQRRANKQLQKLAPKDGKTGKQIRRRPRPQ
jgi:hypothetical protein